ncbi:MAG: NTP transferase domain-containing protein [Azospirillaceae bacterium]
MSRHPTTVVVLAGGRGTRMGALGRVLPKSLVSISPDDTSLSRLLGHVDGHGLPSVVSTNLDDAPLIERFVARCAAERSIDPAPRVIANPAHDIGPVTALSRALEAVETSACAVCLGDIVFAGNPFDTLAPTGDPAGSDNVVVTSELVPGQGGVIESVDGRVTDAVYRREDLAVAPDRHYTNWSGMMRLETDLLRRAVADAADEILESVVAAALDHAEVRLAEARIGFVNINTGGDLAQLWARAINEGRCAPRPAHLRSVAGSGD